MLEWISIVEVFILIFFTYFLLYRYKKRSTPFYVQIVVYIGWFVGFLIVITLPADIYISSEEKNSGVEEFLDIWW